MPKRKALGVLASDYSSYLSYYMSDSECKKNQIDFFCSLAEADPEDEGIRDQALAVLRKNIQRASTGSTSWISNPSSTACLRAAALEWCFRLKNEELTRQALDSTFDERGKMDDEALDALTKAVKSADKPEWDKW